MERGDMEMVPYYQVNAKMLPYYRQTLSINVDEELKEMISYERNRQLNQFSNIYFNLSLIHI